MNKTRIVFWPALTPALSPRRGRIFRRVFSDRKCLAIRPHFSANNQPAATLATAPDLLPHHQRLTDDFFTVRAAIGF